MEAGLPLSELSAHPVIDVNFDGADEIDPSLNCIKGGGGCHLQEKLVAAAAKKFVVVADYRKESTGLGIEWKKGVPKGLQRSAQDLFSDGLGLDTQKLEALGFSSVLRMGAPAKAGPAVTDSGNLILDVFVGVLHGDAAVSSVHQKIKLIPGVVETGLFIGMAGWAYLGLSDGSVKVLTNVTAQELQSLSI
ncbi:hypothetical protein HDU83_009018 [Entophlyctis luteolus]|nr:hypothetical protein HDU83_009018 [Entophlyctis luteolus]